MRAVRLKQVSVAVMVAVAAVAVVTAWLRAVVF
jgi:hypothetical protein